MKEEYYVKVQRRKSLKYGDKQHYQYYITIPIEISSHLELQTGQIMKCSIKGNGKIIYFKTEKKENNKLNYEQWISIVRKFTPSIHKPGKTYRQICKEGNIPLRSAPALWVKQAQIDIGLTRKMCLKTRRILWTISRPEESHIHYATPRLNELASALIDTSKLD